MYLVFEEYKFSESTILQKGQIYCSKKVDMASNFIYYRWAVEQYDHYSVEVIFLNWYEN